MKYLVAILLLCWIVYVETHYVQHQHVSGISVIRSKK